MGPLPSEVVGLLREGETGYGECLARPRNFKAKRRFGLRARFAQDGKRSQSLAVDLRHQEGFAAVVLFPYLANLNLSCGHITNVDRNARGVNPS